MPNLKGNCSECKEEVYCPYFLYYRGDRYDFCCLKCLYDFVCREHVGKLNNA